MPYGHAKPRFIDPFKILPQINPITYRSEVPPRYLEVFLK